MSQPTEIAPGIHRWSPPILEGGRRNLADALEACPWTITAHLGSA